LRHRGAYSTFRWRLPMVSGSRAPFEFERAYRALVRTAYRHRREKARGGGAQGQGTQSETDHRYDSSADVVGPTRWKRRILQPALPGLRRPLRGAGARWGLDGCRPPARPERCDRYVATDGTFSLRGADQKWSAERYRICEIDRATRIPVRTVRNIIRPADRPSFDATFARALGAADFDGGFRIVTASGKVKHIHAVAHLLELVADRPVFIGAIQDVTENKLAEEALDRARSELA